MNDRQRLVRDLDDWRNLVEYLRFEGGKIRVRKLGEIMAKAVILIYPNDTIERYTRH